ncbi:MAG: hypothetical protein KBS35_00685 [Mycoplasma sp.]|nr:hypothetical protein [Candidatus Hennigella equi]
MKLVKKLIPLGTITAVAAGMIPLVASCTSGTGWVNGKSKVNTDNFELCKEQLIHKPEVWEESPWWYEDSIKATKHYVEMLEQHPNLYKDDFRYSMNQWYQMTDVLVEAAQARWPGMLDSLLEEMGLPEDIVKLVELMLPYSPLRSITANTIKGRISNLDITTTDYVEGFYASYKKEMDLNLTIKVGFDYLDKDIIEMIKDFIGLEPVLTLNIDFKVKTDSYKIPFIMWPDTLRIYRERLETQNNKVVSKAHGLAFVPNLQSYEYLGKDQEWNAKLDYNLSITLKSNGLSFKLFSDSKESFLFDYILYNSIFGPQANRIRIPEWFVLVSEYVVGWGSYYYSTQEYPMPYTFN